MSYDEAAVYSWIDETVIHHDINNDSGSVYEEAIIFPSQYQQQDIPYPYDATNWMGGFEQQPLHYDIGQSQSDYYSQSENTDATILLDASHQIASLSSRLFPRLIPIQPPAIPNPNRDNIRQVKIPLNDIYRPDYISKEGSEREGCCRYCATWANLKHSNYAYHMLKRHGVCKAHSQQFEPPRAMEVVDGGEGREGQRILVAWCESCENRIQLAGNPDLEGDFPRLTASWYSHVKGCLLSTASLD